MTGSLPRRVGLVRDFNAYEGEVEDVTDPADANVITSQLLDSDLHAPVIDVDLPMRWVPSSTPGHGHLYIDHPMPAAYMWALIELLAEIGLVEPGYLRASQARGYTSVRLPWVKK